MGINIGKRIESDFTDPLGMLSDCHRRIEKFLQVLVTVAAQARGARLNEEERNALTVSLNYFHSAAPKHTADEEESLFPRLHRSDSAVAATARATLSLLQADHLSADRLHAEIDKSFLQWLSEGELSNEAYQKLWEDLTALTDIYRAHIRIEDEQLFPLAKRCLSSPEIVEIGQEMAARRGVPYRNRPGF